MHIIFQKNKKIPAPTTSQELHGTLYGITFSCGCVCWYSKHVSHCFVVFSMSAFIFTLYMDSLAKNLFLCPYGCCAVALIFFPLQYKRYAYSFAFHGNAMLMIASSCQNGQYFCAPCSTLTLLCGQPCRSVSCWVAACTSSTHVHNSISTGVLITCMFMLMPVISRSLFSVWLFWDNQSIMYRLG